MLKVMPFTSFLLLIFLVEFYYFSRNKTLWTLAPRTLEPRSTQAEYIGEHVCWLAADRIESAVTGHLSPDNCPFPKLLGLDRQTSSRGQVIESRTLRVVQVIGLKLLHYPLRVSK